MIANGLLGMLFLVRDSEAGPFVIASTLPAYAFLLAFSFSSLRFLSLRACCLSFLTTTFFLSLMAFCSGSSACFLTW